MTGASAGSCDLYDQVNRLTRIQTGSGSTCTAPTTVGTYTYDGTGLRMSKTVGASTTQFAWDESGSLPQLLQETTGSTATRYVDGPQGTVVEQVNAVAAISRVGVPSTAADPVGANSSLTLTLPASIAAGDQILVATTYAAGVSNGNSASAPAGYSAVGAPVSSGGTGATADVTQLFRKQSTGGETSVTVSYNGAFAKAAIAVVYRGVDSIAPVEAVGTGSTPSGTTVSASATTLYDAEQVVLIQGATYTALTGSGSWTAPTATTEQSQKDATTTTIGLADASQTTAGPTGALQSTFTVSGTLVSSQLTTILVGLKPPPTTVYYHHDQLGSTRLVTDARGATAATYTFDPYGATRASSVTEQTSIPFLYAGQYRDAESGLYYLHARYYDPATAQFLSRDPLEGLTKAPYGYSGNNPLNGTDPSGLCGWNPFGSDSCIGDAAGAVRGAIGGAANAVGSQVVSWAGDINNFGNTHTFGVCGTASIGVGVGVSGSGCFSFNFHSAGFTGTVGVGFDLPGGADVGVGPMVSDAHSVDELGGAFTYGGASLGEGATANAEVGGGTLPCGRDVHYAWEGGGVGVNVPFPLPLSIWGGGSNTRTKTWSW